MQWQRADTMDKPILAVRKALSRYATFSGRASRPEFWWFVLALWIVGVIAQFLDWLLFGRAIDVYELDGGPISFLLVLFVLLPGIALAVRRLHDSGRSGWWLLLEFVPVIGWLVLLFFYLQRSDPGPNHFGSPEPFT
jgi:uncharacterized membrane protein YhaH (DUF805 family)